MGGAGLFSSQKTVFKTDLVLRLQGIVPDSSGQRGCEMGGMDHTSGPLGAAVITDVQQRRQCGPSNLLCCFNDLLEGLVV